MDAGVVKARYREQELGEQEIRQQEIKDSTASI
jgi:hypothetical protein